MQFTLFFVSALAGVASAYYKPDTSKPPTGNPIGRPLNEVVPSGAPFTISWTPTTPGKVSILFLQGPANNVVYKSTIADSIDNTGSYVWNVGTDITPATSGYAIEIVSQDGSYQYSSQIGIGPAASKDQAASSSFGSIETAAPSGSALGTAVCGALDECASTSFGSVETAPPSTTTFGTAVCGALDECDSTTAVTTPAATSMAATGTGNVTSPIVSPTGGMSVPTSLATVAAPTITSQLFVGATGGSASPTSKVSAAFAAPGAQLSGVAALVAGLVGLLAL